MADTKVGIGGKNNTGDRLVSSISPDCPKADNLVCLSARYHALQKVRLDVSAICFPCRLRLPLYATTTIAPGPFLTSGHLFQDVLGWIHLVCGSQRLIEAGV